jgi:hypothetical protein
MKTNIRNFYSIIIPVVGLAAIKNIYTYYRNINDLELRQDDYFFIGIFSGILFSQTILGTNFLLYGLVIGGMYGHFYYVMLNYFINKRRKKAEKIGILL